MEKDKVYTSYEQVNRDLAIYKLEMELYREKLKNDVDNVKEDLSFSNVISGFFNLKSSKSTGGSWISRILVSFAPWTTRMIWKLIR